MPRDSAECRDAALRSPFESTGARQRIASPPRSKPRRAESDGGTLDTEKPTAGAPDNDDGHAEANLTYRITALYSRRDSVLGASAGLKHFGIRWVGRSGLTHDPPVSDPASPTDDVWDVDCSSFFPTEVDGAAIHGAYFVNEGTLNLMRHVLRGLDRGVLDRLGYTKGAA